MLAITRLPSDQMGRCQLTYVARSGIDLSRARAEHRAYCDVLAACGARVATLEASPELPDCTFVEDTAVVLDEIALLCRPGNAARRPETVDIEPILREHREIVCLPEPATLEGGDVLRVGRQLLVGLSSRTNEAGVAALAEVAGRHGYRVHAVPVTGCLHLKTACTALPDGRLLVNPAWIEQAALRDWEQIPVPDAEPWGANVALVGSHVIAAAHHRQTVDRIQGLGWDVRTVPLAEFAKAEGGVTCLSLLLNERP